MANKYPVWKYHADKMPEGLIVYDAEQDAKLGSGWVESPADFEKAAPESVPTDAAPVQVVPVAHDNKKPRKRGHA